MAHNTTLSNRLCWFDIIKAQAQDVLKSTTNSLAFSNGNIWCSAWQSCHVPTCELFLSWKKIKKYILHTLIIRNYVPCSSLIYVHATMYTDDCVYVWNSKQKECADHYTITDHEWLDDITINLPITMLCFLLQAKTFSNSSSFATWWCFSFCNMWLHFLISTIPFLVKSPTFWKQLFCVCVFKEFY